MRQGSLRNAWVIPPILGRYLAGRQPALQPGDLEPLNEGLARKTPSDPRTWDNGTGRLLKKTVGSRDALRGRAAKGAVGSAALPGDRGARWRLYGCLLGGDGEDVTEEHFQHLSSRLRAYGKRSGMVTEHYGETIYAGGDELLALAPRIEAIPLARELRNNFPDNLAEKVTRRGSTASMGITIFHYRHDLRTRCIIRIRRSTVQKSMGGTAVASRSSSVPGVNYTSWHPGTFSMR